MSNTITNITNKIIFFDKVTIGLVGSGIFVFFATLILAFFSGGFDLHAGLYIYEGGMGLSFIVFILSRISAAISSHYLKKYEQLKHPEPICLEPIAK